MKSISSRSAVALIAAASFLSACTTTSSIQTADAAIQKNLPKVCSALETVYLAFAAIAVTGKVKTSLVNKVDAAYEGVHIVCVVPAQATSFDVIIRVTQAVVVVTAALKEARNVQ